MTQPIPPLSRARATELIEAMRGVKVALIGDVMLDRYLMGDAERISPEAPVPIISVQTERNVPGGAANVALNAATIGAIPRLIGCIGDDQPGEALLELLTEFGIDSGRVLEVPGRITTVKTRIIARGQQVVRIDREVTNPLQSRDRERVLAETREASTDADVVLIEDYDKGTIDAAMAAEIIATARAQRIPVVVDPKLRNFFAYSGATVFKPNRRELELAFNTHYEGDDADLEDARQRLGADHLLLTLGADGMALVSPNQPVRRATSLAREVYDVSGAGDTVAAWIACAIGAGADLAAAAWLANLAAGISVGKRGTAPVGPHEVLDQL